MMLRKLLLGTFVKNLHGTMLLEKLLRNSVAKTTVPNSCSENCRSKRSSKRDVTECCQKN